MSELNNTTILLVDDDVDTCNMLRMVLEGSGASVVTAHSVEDAVEAFRRCPPHATITDIRIGNSDGYRLIQAIRELNEQYKGFTPVMAITGFASPDEEKRALSCGFNAYLTKPVDPTEMVRLVSGMLSRPHDLAA